MFSVELKKFCVVFEGDEVVQRSSSNSAEIDNDMELTQRQASLKCPITQVTNHVFLLAKGYWKQWRTKPPITKT